MADRDIPMKGSYQAIFIGSIIMSFFILLSGSKGGFGTVFWGYAAWLMYKRNIDRLISMFNFSLYFVGFAFLIGIFFLIKGTFHEGIIGHTIETYFLVFLIAGLIFYSLRTYFKNISNGNIKENMEHIRSSAGNINQINESISKYPVCENSMNSKMSDEEIYLKIHDELENGKTDKALWIRLYSELDGNENRTKASYIRNRFHIIKSNFENTQNYAEDKWVDSKSTESNSIDNISNGKINLLISKFEIDEKTATEMIKYEITFENDFFIYKTYRYEKLKDAIAYAKLDFYTSSKK